MVTQQAGSLAGFDHSMFTHDGRAHEVFRAGTGPAVIVIHEMPGLHPGVVEFAQRLIDAGYMVFLPALFGRPGEPFSNAAIRRSVAGWRPAPSTRAPSPQRKRVAGSTSWRAQPTTAHSCGARPASRSRRRPRPPPPDCRPAPPRRAEHAQ